MGQPCDLRSHIIKASKLLNAYDPGNFNELSFDQCYSQVQAGKVFFFHIKDLKTLMNYCLVLKRAAEVSPVAPFSPLSTKVLDEAEAHVTVTGSYGVN